MEFGAALEPGRDYKISEATVQAICKQGWRHEQALSLQDQRVATPAWHEQVWMIQVPHSVH